MQFKVKTYPVDRVLGIAFAAYRKNDGYVKQTNGVGSERVWSNKELVSFTMSSQEGSNWVPETFVPLEITDVDNEKVTSTKQYIKRYTLNLLSGDITSFQQDVFDAVMSDEITANKISLIAYVPEFVERELKQKEYVKRLKAEFANSVHYTDRVTGVCEILKSFYLKNYETYLYVGGIDGNLVTFTNTSNRYVVGKKYKLTAKTKKADQCNDTKLPQTRLNYVKMKEL